MSSQSVVCRGISSVVGARRVLARKAHQRSRQARHRLDTSCVLCDLPMHAVVITPGRPKGFPSVYVADEINTRVLNSQSENR